MDVAVVGLRCGRGDAITGNPAPPLSWRLQSALSDVRQDAYRVQVARDASFDDPIADTGEVRSPYSLYLPWPAAPLQSRAIRYWRVRAGTNHGWTDWSAPAFVEA